MTETVVQKLANLVRDASFSFFVLAFLIFTVVAVTYHPQDPWIHSSPGVTNIFTRAKKTIFKNDNSIITTGEDFAPAFSSVSPAVATVGAISGFTINASEEKVACVEKSAINCSDPGVLFAVEKHNMKNFRSILFLNYTTPVNGSRPSECDVAWNFRNRKEGSWRRYRDFRRFVIARGQNCTYKVRNSGSWHSGRNARRSVVKIPKSMGSTGSVIIHHNDKVMSPTVDQEKEFRKGKYLYYSRGGDHCKGMNQFLWSLLCALGESQYLNRTFVMDLSICLADSYNPSSKVGEEKDFRNYFDFNHLKEAMAIVEEDQFLQKWRNWDKTHKRKMSVRKISSYKVTPAKLKKDKSAILWRQFDAPEPENYWYRVCEGLPKNYVIRPWHALWKSKDLMNIVAEISGRMDWDFDAVHVVRGYKAQDIEKWPHLDGDTSPGTLLMKLRGKIKPYRNLYVATNEPFYNYFDKLRAVYSVHLLEDYRELWGNTSLWYNETSLQNAGAPVQFDSYMRAVVDTEILYRAKVRLETFNDLTKDCKDGLNTC